MRRFGLESSIGCQTPRHFQRDSGRASGPSKNGLPHQEAKAGNLAAAGSFDKRSARRLASRFSESLAAMADLERVAGWVVKECGVIVRGFVARSFHIQRAQLPGRSSDFVHAVNVLCPECDPGTVGEVSLVLGHSKKLRSFRSWCLKLNPAFDVHADRESEKGQESSIERPGYGKIANP